MTGMSRRQPWFGRKQAKLLGDLVTYVILSLVGIAFLLPFLWMASNSFKSLTEILQQYPPNFIPSSFSFNNYVEAWNAIDFPIFFRNSIIASVAVVLGQLATASLAGYSFARLRYPGRDALFFLYISLMMVPFTVLFIPLFIEMRTFGWLNSLNAIIFPFMFTPWGTFMMRQFMVTLPHELEDAARIDGCGFFKTYWLIILPLTKPALATLGIFTFVNTWNSFQWPLIVLATNRVKTLPLALASFTGMDGTQTLWHLLMASAMFIVVPILILFVLGQKYYVRGIMTSGIKGGA